MRKYRQEVEFANFICHFGEEVLLNYVEEIVMPAFLVGTRVRIYGGSKYLLHEVQVQNLESDIDGSTALAIVGKFVLDTELQRDQIYVDGKIVPSFEKLKSSPSSLFVLLLENHKLIYVKQVAGAPGLSAFRTTIELLLKQRRADYIHGLFLRNKEARIADPNIKRVTKNSLMDAIPPPNLEIVPMAGSKNLEEFVKQFKVLKEVTIKVVRPNAEINNSGIFDDVEVARAEVNADATSLTHRNPEGLNKAQSIKQISPAMEGSAVVTLRGTGANDMKLFGSNEEISVREPLEVPVAVVPGSSVMYHAFLRLLRSGVLKIGRAIISPENREKLERISNES